MPLLQYFGWVGSFLLAALFAANWCISAPVGRAPESDLPLEHKINIRIHTDHKWPERVVFDTTSPALAQKADAATGIVGSRPPVVTKRQPFDAFAEMDAVRVRLCFRPACSSGDAAEREASRAGKSEPSQIRSRVAARKELTFPNRLHKPPGKS
jgi:hypothetical protein